MQSTPENQPRLTPNAFISDRSSESVQPELQFEGTFSYQELGSASSKHIPLPSTPDEISAQVSQASKRPNVRLIVGILFLFVRSGESILHPTDTPGVGVPVVSENWEVTLWRVHQESLLNGMNTGLGTDTYTPKSGYTLSWISSCAACTRTNRR